MSVLCQLVLRKSYKADWSCCLRHKALCKGRHNVHIYCTHNVHTYVPPKNTLTVKSCKLDCSNNRSRESDQWKCAVTECVAVEFLCSSCTESWIHRKRMCKGWSLAASAYLCLTAAGGREAARKTELAAPSCVPVQFSPLVLDHCLFADCRLAIIYLMDNIHI